MVILTSEFVTLGSAVDRLTLRQVLLAGLDDVVHFGKEFTRYEQQHDGTVRAYFTDGTSATGNILVAADGVGSRIREQFLPHAEVIDSGVRWLGGKTVLTNELRALLPTQLAETFASVPGVGQSMVFGLVAFRQVPIGRLRTCGRGCSSTTPSIMSSGAFLPNRISLPSQTTS